MKALWDVFDTEHTNNVAIKDLKTILQALDIRLEPVELAQVTKQCDPETTGFLKFEKLVDLMEEKLKDADTIEDFVAAM